MSDTALFVGDRYFRSQFDTGQASYTIFKKDDTYYADPGYPGGTPYSGTDAALVLQNAINALTSGGSIFIKLGTYLLNTVTVLKDNVALIGETFDLNSGTILKANAASVYTSDPFAMFDLTSTKGVRFANLTLIGQGSAFGAVKSRGIGTKVGTSFARCLIDHVFFYDMSIGVYAGNGEVWIDKCSFSTMQDYPGTGDGFAIDADGGGLYWFTDNIINTLIASGMRIVANQAVIANNYISQSVGAGGACIILVTSSNVIVANNRLIASPGITLSADAASLQNCKIRGNIGFNPQGIASITVTASPFTYTNNDGVSEAIYIFGGTVSQIAKNAVNLFTSTDKTIWLEPGEAVVVTYSSAPTMKADRK